MNLRFKKVEALLEEDRIKESFSLLKIVAKTIVEEILTENDLGDETTYLEKLYPKNQKVGIWWWFITQAEEFSEASITEVLFIDILISLYFISTFKHKK